MVKEKKVEHIKIMKESGYSNRQIAWLIYKDRSERGQKKVRAILSYITKKALESGSKLAIEGCGYEFPEQNLRFWIATATPTETRTCDIFIM